MPRQAIRELRRNELIDAVIYAVQKHGYAALTVNEIARYAGASTGSIHYYFGSKEALLEATMRNLMSVLRGAVVKRLRGQTDPKARLVSVVSGNFDEDFFTPSNCRVWTQFWAAAPYTPGLARLQRLNRARVASNLRAELKTLIAPEAVEGACASIQSYMDGIWINSAQTGSDTDSGRAQADAIEFLERVVGRRLLPQAPINSA